MRGLKLGLMLSLAAACGGDDGTSSATSNSTSGDAGAPVSTATDAGATTPTGNTPSEPPLYVLGSEIYGADDSTSYLNPITSLDLKPLDPARAIEYTGGRASFGTYGGKVFVAPPNSPVIKRYDIAADGTPRESGQISFANLGFTEVMIDEWSVSFISPTKAYLFDSLDGNIAVWNPTTMEIVGEIPPPDLVRPGLQLDSGTPVVIGDRLVKMVYWNEKDSTATSGEQYLAVYDLTTDKFVELIEERRCPGLNNRVSQDREGNVYFSAWIWGVGQTLTNGAPESCALRIKKGEQRFDPDWVLRFPALTEGRQGAMLNVLDDGTALFSVFHQERATFDDNTDPEDLASTDNWRIWRLDLATMKAAPLEGIDFMAGAASTFRIDGRTFEFVPTDSWSKTSVFEIRDGKAAKQIEVDGWSYQFLKVR